VLRIDPASEGMWRLWKAEHLCNVSLSFVGTEVCGRERGTSVEENRHVSRSLEEKGDNLLFIYAGVSTISRFS